MRHPVWQHAKKMWELGLVVGSAGNVSERIGGGRLAITPTSVPYEVLREEDVVFVDLATGQAVDSVRAPSYELPMHLVIYRERPDVQAVVHTHAPFVTTLSVLRRPLPPVIDEMLIYFGGTVEVAGYAFTGTEEVGRNVVAGAGRSQRRAARQPRQRLRRPYARGGAACGRDDGSVCPGLRAGAGGRHAGGTAGVRHRGGPAIARGTAKVAPEFAWGCIL